MRGSVDSYQTKTDGKRWRIRYDLPPDPETGERRQRTRRGFTTEDEADRALRKVLTSIDDDAYVPTDSTTVGEYLTRWLDGTRVRKTTRARYRQSIECHLLPIIGGIRLQALTAEHLDAAYRTLEDEGGRNAQGLAPKTVRNAHGTIRKALDDAARRRYVVRNVADDAQPPRLERTEMVTWTPQQVQRFLGHVRDGRLYAMWHLYVTTGMRRGELLGLRWTDVDLDRGRLSIVRQLTVVDGDPIVSEPKTKRGVRTISLDGQTAGVLADHRRRQLEERLAAGPVWEDTGLVFTWEDGTLIHPHNPTRWLREISAELGLPNLGGPHGLRHSYATIALTSGVPVKVVSERLGHANISITLETYAHVMDRDDADAAEQAAAAILGT